MTTTPATPPAYPFPSRYGQFRSITALPRTGGATRQYIIQGDTHYTRGGEGMIDFEGGPFVSTHSFIDPDDTETPAFLERQIGAFPCVAPDEVVIGAQWLTTEEAEWALGNPVMRRERYGYALITTVPFAQWGSEREEANANTAACRRSDGE